MSTSLTTRKMSLRHETELAAVLGGRMTRGSGSTWRDKTDGKHDQDTTPYAFAWDGKSTLGKSLSITRDMWTKLVEQADDYLPAIPLRFYGDSRLTTVWADLIALRLDHFAEILDEANTMARVREAGCLSGGHVEEELPTGGVCCEVCGVRM